MPLACHQYHVATGCHRAGCTDGFLAVHYRNHALPLLLCQPCQHVIDDGLRVFEARIVARYDDFVTTFHCLLSHKRTFAFVSVAPCPAHNPALPRALENLVNRGQHVGNGIGSVGVVHYSRHPFGRTYHLKASVHGAHRTQSHKHLVLFPAEHNACPIDRQQIAHVKASNELHKHLLAVDGKLHTLEALLKHLRLEVGSGAQRIRPHSGFSVLRHY